MQAAGLDSRGMERGNTGERKRGRDVYGRTGGTQSGVGDSESEMWLTFPYRRVAPSGFHSYGMFVVLMLRRRI
ncbi:hypothetical protein DPEC_G00144270 [Dallia pectoralis]|uniref:Uncharacterized protein n=1 Tax=Dallia pectoralis TaxID=75939 RepID=A0ACC2GP41_DALPE|nr:hypothetical protein DPEC_G00144270 [Dallia pectoralis]